MPQYKVTAPDGRVYKVTAPDGATQAEIESYVKSQIGAPAQQATQAAQTELAPQERPSGYDLASDLKRQAGLTARNLVTGAMGIPNLIGDAANAAVNLGASAINSVAGTNIPMLDMPSDVTQRAMTGAGLPEPEGVLERLVGVGSAALSGAGAAGAASTARNVPSTVRMITDFFASSPRLQAVGAASGALGVDQAREMGLENPLGLALVGAVSGALPGGAATVGTRAAGGARQAVSPFTTRGKETIVGEALNRLSATPRATAQRLSEAQEIVPGSRPLVSDVARDPGLIGAESALRGMDETGLIAGRRSEQNAARMAELNRLARDDGTLQRAQNKRATTFETLAEPAFDNASPVPIGREWINNPVLRTIRSIRQSPEGARSTVRDALDEVEGMLTQDGVDLTDARVLYAIRKDLDLLRTGQLSGAGKSGRERANMRTAQREITQVIRALDDTIEGAAPGYRDYMQMFAKRSIPVSQLQALQSLRERAVLAAPDPITGDDVISQAKFTNLLRNNLGPTQNRTQGFQAAANLRGNTLDESGRRAPVLGELSANQIRRIDRIAADLDRGAAISAGTIKTQGSDTFKNLSVAAVIGRVLGDKTGELVMNSSAGKTVARPFSFLYRMPDRDIQLLMLEAWADPQLAARLMRTAQRAEIEGVARELARRAAVQTNAAAVYGQQQP